jgi:hypothetical protein
LAPGRYDESLEAIEMAKAINKEAAAEAGKGIRNFRQSSDVENFYRFVHDNGLRREAKMILETVYTAIKKSKKKARRPRKTKTLQ